MIMDIFFDGGNQRLLAKKFSKLESLTTMEDVSARMAESCTSSVPPSSLVKCTP